MQCLRGHACKTDHSWRGVQLKKASLLRAVALAAGMQPLRIGSLTCAKVSGEACSNGTAAAGSLSNDSWTPATVRAPLIDLGTLPATMRLRVLAVALSALAVALSALAVALAVALSAWAVFRASSFFARSARSRSMALITYATAKELLPESSGTVRHRPGGTRTCFPGAGRGGRAPRGSAPAPDDA